MKSVQISCDVLHVNVHDEYEHFLILLSEYVINCELLRIACVCVCQYTEIRQQSLLVCHR